MPRDSAEIIAGSIVLLGAAYMWTGCLTGNSTPGMLGILVMAFTAWGLWVMGRTRRKSPSDGAPPN